MPRNPKKARAKALQAAAEAQPAKIESDEEMHDEQDPSTSDVARHEVFRPGVHKLGADETLDYDRTAYDCLHKWSLDWPCLRCLQALRSLCTKRCSVQHLRGLFSGTAFMAVYYNAHLSFEFIKDGLGGPRSKFPHTAYLIAGTQAAARQQNYLSLMKLSELGQGDHGKKGEEELYDDMLGGSDSEEEEETALFHFRKVALQSAANRVRCMHQQPGIVAVWTDKGQVSVYNCSKPMAELAEEKTPLDKKKNNMLRVGGLASGDTRGKMHVWTPVEGGSWTVSGSYQGHNGSVEDVEWSPTEGTVLASACVDKHIRIFDTRDRSKAQISLEAHSADVNVISWNTLTSYMLASGGDDSCMRVWDLRALSDHVASFSFHRAPITGIEWCPQESSMLATTSEDNTAAVWDLALERDPEEEASLAPVSAAMQQDTPPQLLFLHAGQQEIKEVHWHAQIPGMLATTAGDSFNVFKPANVFEIAQQEGALQ